MLAAIDRGFAKDWRKLVDAVRANPDLRPTLKEALDAAESASTVALVKLLLARAERTPAQIALERLREAFYGTQMTQAELAGRIGTSRTRLNSYLTGKVTPSMDVLVAVEEIARETRAPSLAAKLVIYWGVPERVENVCICGSMRFLDEMRAANRDLSLSGVIVLSPVEAGHVNEEQKAILGELHLRKIDLADRVLVVNPGGYLGESATREIEYARSLGKPVVFTDTNARD